MLVAGLVVIAGAIGVTGAALLRREHAIARRIARAAGRLEGRIPAPVGRLGEQLDDLDRSVESATARLSDALASEQLVRALDAIPQGVVICDAEGTRVFENDVGAVYSQARHGDALVSAAIDEQLLEARVGAPASTEIELFGPPRRVLQIDAYPLALAADGTATGALAIIEDVSERRRLELVRRDFVANISHELKTPVGALALLAETLIDSDDGEDRARLAHRMLAEAHRVGDTIEDLLSLSAIEGDQEADRIRLPVRNVVEEVVARTASAAEQRAIDVAVEVDGDPWVQGDSRQLTSALFNLVDNALKYSEPGASVDVGVRQVDGWVEIAVVDHGPGIAARDHERIFERFYRVDPGRSRETGGTGLGLAIVRHVATNHGGEITVRSLEGEGATFTLRLPAIESPTPEECT
ncbi:MAG: sensor histidine kinase [Acidimicrobiales bacterium]|nr:sensor histidine kinase [Acidimicrobiales bacterium]